MAIKEKENTQRICHICNSPIKPKEHWDNPRRDPMYPSLWLCKKHSMSITIALKSTYDRWVSEARKQIDRSKGKRKGKKILEEFEKET